MSTIQASPFRRREVRAIVAVDTPPEATLLIAALAVLAAPGWQYQSPAPPRADPPAASAPAPSVPEGIPEWRDLVGPLAKSQSMPIDEVKRDLLPRVAAFLDANPGERPANLARAAMALGPNSPLIGDRVIAELRRTGDGAADVSGLRALGLAVSADLGLSLRAMVEVTDKAGPPQTPGFAALTKGLLDPAFPVNQYPPACSFVDLLEAYLPKWGVDAAVDARLTAVLASCPGQNFLAVEKGLADKRPEVRAAALHAWDEARRSGKPSAVEQPASVADAIVRMLERDGLPPKDPERGLRDPAEIAASSLAPLERVEEGMAALGNAGRQADMRALGRAAEAARKPKGSQSLRDLVE